MVEYLPEWQLQEILEENPERLEVPGRFEGLRLAAAQRYVAKIGGYADLVLKTRKPGGLLVVELKANKITDLKPAYQVLKYRDGLSAELHVAPRAIHCMVAAPGPVDEEIAQQYESLGIGLNTVDLKGLTPLRSPKSTGLLAESDGIRAERISDRRRQTASIVGETMVSTPQSIRKWISEGSHDERSLRDLANLLRWISATAPIFAHEVGSHSQELDSFERQWFWLFYSSIDRRGNAALFVRAKEHLESVDLFMPARLRDVYDQRGEREALRTLSTELRIAKLPLVIDLHYGRESLSKSIMDAARLVCRYNLSFGDMLNDFRQDCGSKDLGHHVVGKLRDSVYGLGPRSAAQFVRGMVLKGPWRLPLTDGIFLEDTKYNALFAGPARLTVATEEYRKEAKAFADRYLGGDKAILSHALWFIRKRYCDKVPQCSVCPAAGYCAFFRSRGLKRKASPKSHSRSLAKGTQTSLID